MLITENKKPKHNKTKRTYSYNPFTNHFRHKISLQQLREKYSVHRKQYCDCNLKKEAVGHVQILLPHNKDILKCDLENKLYEVQNILHRTIRKKYPHWTKQRIQQFQENHIKTTMFYEHDYKYIALHRKQKSKWNLKYIIFSTIASFKTDPANTKKWHWHHDRCIPPPEQIQVVNPKKRENLHDCHLHNKQEHKTQPKGYTKSEKTNKKLVKHTNHT